MLFAGITVEEKAPTKKKASYIGIDFVLYYREQTSHHVPLIECPT